ncbi:nitrite reductase [Cytobacillus gottheilii]|uniref:nitrite reductase n=1 Tax=Cytobacillus gottheilii TaxID=859144 RepID=UPI00249534F1|nr:nitrite reductase [Cytobacillus gottheilii]
MDNKRKKIKIAVNGGIDFGAKLSAKQLLVIAKYMDDNDQLELTTFQQIYIEIFEDDKDEIIEEFEQAGLHCYPVGRFVKSLRTCNFCKGAEEEGMPVAKEINNRIAGKPVPFTLKAAYTGCPVGCGEPLINDIGIMKMKDHYDLYIGGKSKGQDAEAGTILLDKLTPDELYAAVEKVIEIYQQDGKKRETFHKFVNRIGREFILEKIKG